MKGFEFSLQRIHNYKGQVLNEEKNNLSLLYIEKKELLDKIDYYEAYINETNKEMLEKQSKGISVLELSTYKFKIDHTRTQIYQTLNEIAVLDKEIQKQTNVVLEASKEVKGLDKLYEHQKDDFNKQIAKNEEDTIAEIISSRQYRDKSAV